MLYPSLEDMKVDQMMQEQQKALVFQRSASPGLTPSAPPTFPFSSQPVPEDRFHAYPALDDYMGLSLTSDEMALVARPNYAVAVEQDRSLLKPSGGMVAPLSGSSVGLRRALVTHGLREVTLCKEKNGKVGIRVKAINKGIFVVLVTANSPAAMVGLRFGDQILSINDELVAGYSMEKVHDILKKAPNNGIKVVVRDRPFERTITLHKDSTGHTGFSFKDGKINAIVKDSSAARNGLLIDHHLLEINGQNVVGVQDKVVRSMIDSAENTVTVTIMPSPIYEHMMKQMATSLVKKLMDHSVPEL